MKNIFDILKGTGIEIPEDKKKDFNSTFNENYKTINEVEKISNDLKSKETEIENYKADISKRDDDLKALQKQLKDAGTSQEELDKANAKIDTLTQEYADYKKNSETKLQKQAYEFAVNQKVAGLKFSSNSAKKAFLSEIMKDELKMKDGELIGFDDYVETYKKEDEGAFLKEEQTKKPTIKFSGKSGKVDEPEDVDESEDVERSNPVIW